MSAAEADAGVSVIVVMGVSGSGKTTIGKLLAGTLHWPFADADAFHPPANVRKMAGGVALTDEDRWPWLAAIAAWIDEHRGADRPRGVVTCSALKRSYLDVIIGGRRDVRLVYLEGDRHLIAQRMATRRGHFMPVDLLQSQFDTLEAPTSDERPVVVSIDATPGEIVQQIAAALALESPARRTAAERPASANGNR
jgi:gluconokinase